MHEKITPFSRSIHFLLLSAITIATLAESCKKSRFETGQTPTSPASIISFLFPDSVNNYILGADVSGIIGPDTIHLVVPGGISITNLVPSISFVGKNITPANGIPEDFSMPLSIQQLLMMEAEKLML